MKYTVMPGDTMYKIAQRHGVSLDDLIKANPDIKDPELIFPGQVIEVPISKPGVPLPELPPAGGFPPFPTGPAGPLHPPVSPGIPPELPPGVSPGMPPKTPGSPGGGIMPGFPGGGMMPGLPGGGMMPGFPGGGMMPGFPGGGMMPGFPGRWGRPGYPGGIMKPGYSVSSLEAQGFKQGDTGEHIKYLQERLKDMGYYKGSVTGRFGSMTKSAVKKLQKDCSLPENGIVDQYVWAGISGRY